MTSRLVKYSSMTQIGSGSFGKVFKVYDTERNKTIAVKTIYIPNEMVRDAIEKELEILKNISKQGCNPFLTCYYNSYYIDNTLYIEMEYIDGKTMDEFAKEYIDKGDIELLHKYLIAMSQDILRGLKYLHSNGIIHRDIKPENIMIDKNNVPKIIDVGLGCFPKVCMIREEGSFKNIDCCHGIVGTPNYIAPELWIYQKAFLTSDIWSLGVSLYKVVTGILPYDASDFNDLRKKILKNQPPKLSTSNRQLNRIVNNMLIKNYTLRPTAEQLLNKLYDNRLYKSKIYNTYEYLTNIMK